MLTAAAVTEGGQPAHGRGRAVRSATTATTANGTEHGHAILERRRCLLADTGLALGIVVVVAFVFRRRTAQDCRGSCRGGVATGTTMHQIISTQQRRLGTLLVRQRWADAQHRPEFSLAGLRDESLVVMVGSMRSMRRFVR